MNHEEFEKLIEMLDKKPDPLDELIVIKLSELKELITKKRLVVIT